MWKARNFESINEWRETLPISRRRAEAGRAQSVHGQRVKVQVDNHDATFKY